MIIFHPPIQGSAKGISSSLGLLSLFIPNVTDQANMVSIV